MMLGFLLARAGVDVVVLEKHRDFLRDFRGDTIHPSTLELMWELGLLEEFLKRPHQKTREIAGQVGEQTVLIGDFTHLPTHCKFLALMPQWDFLNFIAEQGKRYPEFHLRMQAEAVDLIEDDGRIIGSRAKTTDGTIDIRAGLTVGADGRRSIVRERGGLEVMDLGAPMDVLWMRVSRSASDPGQTLGKAAAGKIFIMIDREEYWQCGYVIPKGAAEETRNRGIEKFREELVNLAPFLADRIGELRDWNDISLLTVKVDRLKKWFRPGLLCIGDSAHAMSPVGGVGINLAIQDAVAAANILWRPLSEGRVSDDDLAAVQAKRERAVRILQGFQSVVQTRFLGPALASSTTPSIPLVVRIVSRLPFLRDIPPRLIAFGIDRPHVESPERTR